MADLKQVSACFSVKKSGCCEKACLQKDGNDSCEPAIYVESKCE